MRYWYIRNDIPLRRDDVSRFLPWILALLFYLGAIFLSVAVSFQVNLARIDEAYRHRVTVQIPAGDKASEQALVAQAVLEETEGYVTSEIVPRPRVEAMLRPWLEFGGPLDSLPLPTVVEARFEETVDADALYENLSARIDGVRLDANRAWLAGFSGMLASLQWFALGVVALILAVTTAIVVFLTRLGLKLHHRTVELLEWIGATDLYIARQFQHHMLQLVLKGAVIGLGAAIPSLLALHLALLKPQIPLLPKLNMGLLHFVILGGLLLASLFITHISSRLTVMHMLRRQ